MTDKNDTKLQSDQDRDPNQLVKYSSVNSLSECLEKLVNNEMLSDVIFFIGPEKTKFFGHKVILCSRSDYFKAIFLDGKWKETQEGVYENPNIEPSTFLSVLKYIYTGTVELCNDNVLNILAVADEMQLNELKTFCADHVKENIDTKSALKLLDLAYKYCSDELIHTCYEFVKMNTAEVLKEVEQLSNISETTCQSLLASEDLGVDEIEVFSAMIQYGLRNIMKKEKAQQIKIEESTISEDDKKQSKQKVTNIIGKFVKKPKKEENAMEDEKIQEKSTSEEPYDWRKHKFDLKRVAQNLTDRDRALLKEQLKDMIPLIRYALMDPHQLTDIVEPYGIVDDCFLLEAYRHICAPDRSNKSHRTRIRKGLSVQLSSEFGGSIILSEEHKKILLDWCEIKIKKRKTWKLLYKATRDGFDSRVFHQICDNKGPTITVCHTTDGYIFGGFNSKSWNSKGCWVTSSDNWLFSLVNPFNDGPRKLKVKNPQRAVYNAADMGPTFGGGGGIAYFDPYDIYIDSTMSRGHTNLGNAYSTFRGGWRSDQAQRSLAGSLNAWRLDEVEVFALQ